MFGIFETPETKAEYEARQVEKQLEKEEKQKQKEEEKAEQKKQQAKEEQEKADQKQKEQEEKEQEKQKEQEQEQEKQKKEENQKTQEESVQKKEQKTTEKTDKKKTSSKTESNGKASDKTEQKIELNYLKQLNTRENPVMNGTRTEKIGTYGFIKAEKDIIEKEVSDADYIEFCNDRVKDSGYNWFTIDFGDGTGIVFTGCIPATGTYGYIDQDRCLTETIYYITINEDNTVTLSEPSY